MSMMGFSDPALAVKTRDALTAMMVRVLDQERPDYTYGTVTQIDADLGSCKVLITGDTVAVRVAFGAFRPTRIGQVVRVSGHLGDRFISDIIGGAIVADVPTDVLTAPTLTLGGGYRELSAYWTEVVGAAKYEIQFANDSGFTSGLVSFTTISNALSRTPVPATLVYGRVRALTSDNRTGPWSTTQSVTPTDVPYTPLSDGSPPASSPQPVVTGGLGFILAEWIGVANVDITSYDVHVSTVSGFTPTAGTLVGNTTGTFYFIRRLPGGGNLTYGTTYYVRLIAKDRDGAAAVGAQGSGSPSQVETGDVGRIATSEIGDGIAPAASPAPVITNGIGFLYATWTHQANADPVTYEVHVSTATGFTPSSNTLVGTTPSNFFYIKKQGPGGTPANGDLVYGTTYFVKLIAKDVDGQAAAGAQGSGTPVKIATVDVSANAITSTELNALAVTEAKVAANAITTTKIAADAVTAAQIAANAVTTSELNALAVTTAKIANQAITTTQIAALAVTTGELAANAVTTAKINNLAVDATKLADLAVLDTKIAANAVTTAKIAADAVTAAQIASGAVGNAELAALAVATGNIQASAITTTQIADLAVQTAKLAAGAVDSTKLADLAVTVGKIADLAVTTTKIANDAVTSAQIAANAVGDTELAALAVTEAKIAASAITTAKIAADAVTAAQIATGAVGDTELAALAVTEAKIAASAITTAKIANDAVTAAQIAANAVGEAELSALAVSTAKIQASAITTALIANDAVTAAQIAANAVGETELNALAVTEAKIAASAVSTAKIVDGAIAAAKIAAGAVDVTKLNVQVGGGNLLVNSSAEDTTSTQPVVAYSTSPVVVSNVNEQARYGTRSMKLVFAASAPTGFANAARTQQISAVAGDKYVFSCWIYNGGSGVNPVATSEGAGTSSTVLTLVEGSAVTWGRYAASVTVNVTHATWGVYIQNNSATAKTVYVDGIQIERGDVLTAYAPKPDEILPGTVGTTEIAAGAITAAKIAANTITANEIGANAITASELAAGAVVAGKIAAGTIVAADIAANTITAAQIAADTITAAQIAASAITSSELAAGAVIAGKITAGSIVAADLAANTITAAQIAANTITSGQIAADTITASQIAANAITSSELAAGAVTAGKITAGTIVAADIAANTITSGQIAANTITAGNIAANTITAAQIAADTITATEIAALSITSSELAAGAVTAGKITAGTIVAADIAALTITGAQIAAGAITAAKIAADTITANEIAALAITSSELAAGAVTAGKIAALSIVAGDIAASTITGAKIAASTITAGNIAADTITAANIAANAITSSELNAGAVTAGKIAALTIVAGDIAASTITGAKIAASTITAGNIAADTITAAQIAANAITASELNAGAVVAGKIAAGTIVAADIAASTITGAKIAATTITAGNIAANTITAAQIAAGTITATEIAAGAITAVKIAAGSITTEKLTIAALSPNLVPNGGFEEAAAADGTKPANWVVESLTGGGTWGRIANDTANVRAGNGALFLTAPVAAASVASARSEKVKVTGAQPVFISFWVRRSVASTNGFTLNIANLDANNGVISNVTTDLRDSTNTRRSNNDPLGTTYTLVSGQFTPAATAASIQIVVYNTNPATAGTVYVDDIQVNEVTVTAQIADGAIVAAKIAASTITAAQIAANTITSAQIAADTITAGQIAANAITSSELNAGAVTAGKIAALTIVAGDIAASTITGAKIAASTITAGNIAADTITAAQIAANAITSSELNAGAVIAGKIAAGTIVAADIAATTITGAKIAANTITAGNMVVGTITAASGIIADAAIATAKIVDAAITTAKIADLNVSTAKITDAAITTAKINDLAVTTAKIGNAQITDAKIDTLSATKITTGTLGAHTITVSASGIMQSSNYVAGSTGWQIKGDGTVEFASGTFRGAIVGATITGGIVRTAASGKRIQLDTTNIASFFTGNAFETLPGTIESMASGDATAAIGSMILTAPIMSNQNPSTNITMYGKWSNGSGGQISMFSPGTIGFDCYGSMGFTADTFITMTSYSGGITLTSSGGGINLDSVSITSGNVNASYSMRLGEIYGNGGLYRSSGVLQIAGNEVKLTTASNGGLFYVNSDGIYLQSGWFRAPGNGNGLYGGDARPGGIEFPDSSTIRSYNGGMFIAKRGSSEDWGGQALRSETNGYEDQGWAVHISGYHASRMTLHRANSYMYCRNATQGELVVIGDFIDNSLANSKAQVRPLREVYNEKAAARAARDGRPAQANGVRFRDEIKRLRPVEYRAVRKPEHIAKWNEEYEKGYWKDEALATALYEDTRRRMGLVAEELEEVFPEAVLRDVNGELVGVKYQVMIAPLIEAVKELTTDLDAALARIAVLEKR